MARKTVFLAKLKSTGEVIEVVKTNRIMGDYVAVGGGIATYVRGHFSWMFERSILFEDAKRKKAHAKMVAEYRSKAAAKLAAAPRGAHTITVNLTPPMCGCEHDYEVAFKITAHSEPEVTHRAAEDCHPGADAEWEIEQVTCEGNEVSFDDLTKDMQQEINNAVTNAVGEIESERGEEDPDDANDRFRERIRGRADRDLD